MYIASCWKHAQQSTYDWQLWLTSSGICSQQRVNARAHTLPYIHASSITYIHTHLYTKDKGRHMNTKARSRISVEWEQKALKINKTNFRKTGKHVNYPATKTGYCENERMRGTWLQQRQDKRNVNRKRVNENKIRGWVSLRFILHWSNTAPNVRSGERQCNCVRSDGRLYS